MLTFCHWHSDSPLTPSFLPTCTCAVAILSVPLDTPVEDIVILVALTHEEVTEEFMEVRVVWCGCS